MTIELKEGFSPNEVQNIAELYRKMDWWGGALVEIVWPKLLQALQASFKVVLAYDGEQLVGAGRMISDGVRYATIFDVVVLPTHQKKGIGKDIMHKLTENNEHLMIHLTSTFGNEDFYAKLGFKRHKTAFARYPSPSEYLQD